MALENLNRIENSQPHWKNSQWHWKISTALRILNLIGKILNAVENLKQVSAKK